MSEALEKYLKGEESPQQPPQPQPQESPQPTQPQQPPQPTQPTQPQTRPKGKRLLQLPEKGGRKEETPSSRGSGGGGNGGRREGNGEHRPEPSHQPQPSRQPPERPKRERVVEYITSEEPSFSGKLFYIFLLVLALAFIIGGIYLAIWLGIFNLLSSPPSPPPSQQTYTPPSQTVPSQTESGYLPSPTTQELVRKVEEILSQLERNISLKLATKDEIERLQQLLEEHDRRILTQLKEILGQAPQRTAEVLVLQNRVDQYSVELERTINTLKFIIKNTDPAFSRIEIVIRWPHIVDWGWQNYYPPGYQRDP